MLKFFFTIILGFIFYACVKDKPQPIALQPIQLSSSNKVYVVNEGLFNAGNASVSLYDASTDNVITDIFETQNAKNIGDVAQSISRVNGSFYVVVNNSNKVVVCDNNFKIKAQINELTSPRYLLAVSNQKAYVSDLYANTISIVNLNTNQKTSSIPCYGKTEQMCQIYGKVFVTNYDSDFLYVINSVTDKITDSVFVGKKASSIGIDKNDKIWVLGGKQLSRINPVNLNVEQALNFSASDSPFNLCFNKFKDTLYYLNSSIYRMSIHETSLPNKEFIKSEGKNFYGLGVDPNNYQVYVADAIDYVQKSSVYIFNQMGENIKSFKAGVNSNSFYFE